MVNCTIADNFNVYANTIQDEAVRLEETYHQVHNCIIYGNTPYAGRQVNTAPLITHSVIEGGHASGSDIIDQDPQFLAPYAGSPANFDATTYDYNLQGPSPAINVGDNGFVVPGYDLDLNNLPRIQGTIVDLGCYESTSPLNTHELGNALSPWYFDATHKEIRVRGSGELENSDLWIFDLTGRLGAQARIRNGVATVQLPPGNYIAKTQTTVALEFTVVQ